VRKDAIDALMKKKARALVDLEHIEQALDVLIKGTDFQNYRLPLGRLRNNHEPMYRALEQMVARGFLTAKEFEAEIQRARKSGEIA
jgi:hypothetical protein